MDISNIKFYSYNGFEEPKLLEIGFINLKERLQINSNYMRDVTNQTLDEIEEHLKMYDFDIQIMQQYGDTNINGVWIEPTVDNLIEFNQSVMLEDETYLGKWIA